MIQFIYLANFIMALALLPIQIHFYKKHISVYYPIFFICILLCCFGALQISFAENPQAALFANQVNYLGACFTPFFSVLCIADLVKQKIPVWIKVVLFFIAVIVFGMVSVTGIYPLYYKSINIAKWHGATFLVKEYGPLHNLYLFYLVIVMVAALIVILIAFKHRQRVSYITTISLFFIFIISFAAYLCQHIFKLKVELVPSSMVIQEIFILILLNRIGLNDISGITTSTMMESNSYGFAAFRSGKKYIGSEGKAEIWFPELKFLYVDKTLSKDSIEKSNFIKQISEWIDGDKSEKIIYFEREDKIIEAKFSVVHEKGKKTVYLITLFDDTDQQKYNRLIEHYNENLEVKVNEKTEKINQIKDDIIISMASIVENRDGNTGGHIKRTSDVVKIFVHELQKTQKFSELKNVVADCIIKAAPLHDFGKIGIPDSVLNKPGKFTDEEYAIMKLHPEKGAHIVAQILQSSDDKLFNTIAVNIAHFHHEKWNGQGYPKGLKEKEIPFEARVMALADVFDALVSKRVYKEQFSYDKAFKIIEESCGQHFDPDLCREFLKCRPKLEKLYDSYAD